ncbi:metal-dependent hydrolase [Dyadobacter chenwenxiniae]|uniref:Metal-dependent hydrolase n=1 Tax=Dyadobacter chenwenxiniae TaxID=2906456 RepID=A0A9X1TBZ7_9BACT|nr:metal-dependent hydrolase [Dyadobacter chenwenxiniae]MCF0060386.1 metal-dependent hydrolase [Dyadobacter chenwenxiniae]UON86117.1 metal-dependent hydrolase [Dyadobacter chenwenxiniae]
MSSEVSSIYLDYCISNRALNFHSMFIGHFGLSFAAKKAAPKVSLGTLFIATQFVDILWPFLLVTDIEKVAIVPGYTKSNALEFLYFPYTHSLLAGIIWGVVVGLIFWLFKKDKQGAIVLGLCVLSHWFCDLLVHTADLPLFPFTDAKFGFGLWNHVAISLTIETIIYLAGVYIYANFTKAKTSGANWGLWSFVVFLLIFNFANTFGPPPSDSIMTLFITLVTLMVIIISLAYWVDKKRVVR